MSATYINTHTNHALSKAVLKALAWLYFLLLVLTVVYVCFFTQNRFITTATFKISREDASASASLGSLIIPGVSDSGSVDSQVAIGFISSSDLLLDIEKMFHLDMHYSAPKTDFVFRLWRDRPLEERLAFYRKRINARYNIDSGLTVLTVDTFDPVLSQKIAKEILLRAEKFINEINQRVADQQMQFVTDELERADGKVSALHSELVEFQNRHKFISPDREIEAQLTAVHRLQAERLKLETSLAVMMRDSPESPMIDVTKSKIRAINEQMDIETAKLSGPERDRLNQLLVQFGELKRKIGFAEKVRLGVLASLEKHRVRMIAKSRFFAPVQNPYLPEDIGLPRRTYTSISIVILGGLLFLLLRGIIHSVLERP